jgi:hypothetical protein
MASHAFPPSPWDMLIMGISWDIYGIYMILNITLMKTYENYKVGKQ